MKCFQKYLPSGTLKDRGGPSRGLTNKWWSPKPWSSLRWWRNLNWTALLVFSQVIPAVRFFHAGPPENTANHFMSPSWTIHRQKRQDYWLAFHLLPFLLWKAFPTIGTFLAGSESFFGWENLFLSPLVQRELALSHICMICVTTTKAYISKQSMESHLKSFKKLARLLCLKPSLILSVHRSSQALH